MLNGYAPIYSQFGQDIYASDVVQQAVSCIVQECIKLIPKHIKTKGSDIIPVNSDIQRLLRQPNELMTTADFIEKFMWNLMLNYKQLDNPDISTPGRMRMEKSRESTQVYIRCFQPVLNGSRTRTTPCMSSLDLQMAMR